MSFLCTSYLYDFARVQLLVVAFFQNFLSKKSANKVKVKAGTNWTHVHCTVPKHATVTYNIYILINILYYVDKIPTVKDSHQNQIICCNPPLKISLTIVKECRKKLVLYLCHTFACGRCLHSFKHKRIKKKYKKIVRK